MPKRVPQLAKLTRPRLHKAVARERLFALLDEAHEHKAAICVVGPPGAGKTTLVASWLDARSIKGIWYQVDPGDADLATFFYYLGEAAKPFTRKGQRPLPLLTPEYLQDGEGFSRRFFRELFGRLPEGVAVVLDNYQEVGPEQKLHQLIAQAVEEVSPGITMIAVSRRDPPDCYARLIANENVAFVDWEDLKLTFEEARAVGAGRIQLSDSQIAELHEKSGGWTAGLVLLLARWRRGDDLPSTTVSDSLREVFNYFAGQLFDQMPPQSQDELLRLSYLPRMTARTAEDLTGTTTASLLLEDLHRRHLFTDRRATEQRVYQFHALFHAFLQHRAQQTFSPDQDADITRRSAQILDANDHSAEAFSLYLRCGDVPAAIAVILRQASRLIAQGRWRIVVEWIDTLPKEVVENNCWLLHWYGTAKTPVDAKGARVALEASHEAATRQVDFMCQVQAAAGVIQTYVFEYTNFRAMDQWIGVLKVLLEQVTVFENAEAELRARSALLVALSYRKPDDPALDACTDRVFELVQIGGNINLRTLATAYLVAYGTRTGPLEVARKAAPLLEQLIGHPDVTPMSAGLGWFMISFYELVAGDEKKSRAAVSEVERIGRDDGLPAVSRFAAIIGAHVEFGVGNAESARRWSNRLNETEKSGRPYNEAIAESIKAWVAAFDGDPAGAYVSAKRAVDSFDEAGTRFLRCISRIQLALSLTVLRDFAGAQRWISEARNLADTSRSIWLRAEVHFSEAFLGLEEGNRTSVPEHLKRGFELLRISGCDWPLRFIRLWAPRLCAEALELGIEPGYVKVLIRRLALMAPSTQVDQWPWRVRIYTLGHFTIVLDDKVLSFSHKVPRKPIALLKTIIAFGGEDVPETKLMDALWPDEDGAAAREACKIALHRLRKLLGNPNTVQVENGRVGVNSREVWIDANAFEQAVDTGADSGRIERLYQGQFLPEEREAPWALSPRERLRGKFIRHVEQEGVRLEQAGDVDAAAMLYQRGIDADDLAEEFYQGLIRCHIERGRHADAMTVYRRLRQMLSVTLGITPSRESEALFRSVQQA